MSIIRNHALKIVELAEVGQAAARMKRQAFGMNDSLGLDWGSEDSRALAYDTNVGDEQLEQYLQSLDIETLARLHALMYSGRGGETAPQIRTHYSNGGREDMIRAMTEKRPALKTYFMKGLERADKEGLDLDTF